MAVDIKILSVSSTGQLCNQTYPVPDKVTGEYALVQKIVKNLKTNVGSDEQDPGWGSGLFPKLFGIPAQQGALARTAATGSLQKCLRDLKSSQSSDSALTVEDIHLLSLDYNPVTTAWDVAIEVVTASGTIQVPLSG